jgi:hypothetical protein
MMMILMILMTTQIILMICDAFIISHSSIGRRCMVHPPHNAALRRLNAARWRTVMASYPAPFESVSKALRMGGNFVRRLFARTWRWRS